MIEITQERNHKCSDKNGDGTVFFCAEGGRNQLFKRIFGCGNAEILQFASETVSHINLRKISDISADFIEIGDKLQIAENIAT